MLCFNPYVMKVKCLKSNFCAPKCETDVTKKSYGTKSCFGHRKKWTLSILFFYFFLKWLLILVILGAGSCL